MFLWLVAALLAGGQGEAPAKKPIETAHLSLTPSTAETSTPGRVTLLLDVVPKPKMHVYSPGQEGYIAIALTLDADPAFTTEKAKYPAGEKLFMPALKETQLVYAKPFRITQDLTLKSPAGERVTVKGTLRYQACDELVCYLPKTIRVEWVVDRR